jgi:hypothetical protein
MYVKSQLYKIIGFLVLAFLVISVMVVSSEIDLATSTSEDPMYVFAVALSSLCFILVLIGFSKIILFDMASEFGLRDEETEKMIYNARFFLFAALALSFCSSIYLLLDVFLQDTYLELLPVLLMEWVLISSEADIPGLTNLGRGREFYQTARNIYFAFFFLVIVTFSVLVFLTILTSLGRRRVTSRFRKEEVEDEEEENRRLFKILTWFAIPFICSFLFNMLDTSTGPIIGFLILILVLWWIYQLLKFIFLVIWRGFKITAFITSVNALLIIPLILVLYLAPIVLWTIWYIIEKLQNATISLEITQMIQAAVSGFQLYYTDFLRILQLDYVFITIIATFIVGFAEGFALIAIFTAISRGAEVARSGKIIAKSPPKVAVITKYLAMLTVWLGISWDSFREVWNMLIDEFNIALPPIDIPSFFFTIYDRIIMPMSDYLEEFIPTFQYIPLLIIPLYFILAGAFKFLSVTIITPQMKDRLSIFFLLVSTAFVLIITNILGDIHEIQNAPGFVEGGGIQDAPLRSYFIVTDILSEIVGWFDYIEAIAFYCGLLFGIVWVFYKFIQSRRVKKPILAPKPSLDEELELEGKPRVVVTEPVKEITDEEELEKEPTPIETEPAEDITDEEELEKEPTPIETEPAEDITEDEEPIDDANASKIESDPESSD